MLVDDGDHVTGGEKLEWLSRGDDSPVGDGVRRGLEGLLIAVCDKFQSCVLFKR